MEVIGEEHDEIARQVDVGEYVRVWTKDDTWREFEVTALTETSISGAEEDVLFEDITRIEVRDIDIDGGRTVKNAVSVMGGVIIGAAFFALAFVVP